MTAVRKAGNYLFNESSTLGENGGYDEICFGESFSLRKFGHRFYIFKRVNANERRDRQKRRVGGNGGFGDHSFLDKSGDNIQPHINKFS